MTTILSILPNGDIKCLSGDELPLNKLGTVTKKRISHILPVSLVKRIVFRILRFAVGDKGRIADWTRKWKGPWEAIIIETGERFINLDRAKCIEWERNNLSK